MARTRSEASHSNPDSRPKKIPPTNGVKGTRFCCPYCPGSVSRKADLPRHMRQHTGRGLHYCKEPGCEHNKGFTQLSNLRSHHRAVHLRQRHRCPHICVDANGKKSQCNHTYSDQPGLIRHRKEKHGFMPRRDKAKAKETTSKRQADDDDAKGSKPAGPSSAPYPALPASSRRSPRKKSTPMNSTLAPEQQNDWSSLYTLPDAKPSEVVPAMVPNWDLGFGCPANDQLNMQSQPAAGMNVADPLSLPYTTAPAQPGNFDALFNPEPQTAVVNNWSFGPQMAAFDFNFTAASLPLPAGNGVIDPSMLMIPAPVPPTLEQANLANAGLASSPCFYGPGQGTGWESYPSPGSSRESSMSPELSRLFADMPPFGAPSEAFKEYYGL